MQFRIRLGGQLHRGDHLNTQSFAGVHSFLHAFNVIVVGKGNGGDPLGTGVCDQLAGGHRAIRIAGVGMQVNQSFHNPLYQSQVQSPRAGLLI